MTNHKNRRGQHAGAVVVDETHRVPVERKPIGHMTYPGDATGILTEGAKGPNHMGESMWPVTAVHDPETDTTRVGFSLIPPATVTR